ncbi:MAG TPA: biopolymer transporter Tol, partial [Isosphaeraceae bacterium]|nr:biopolymer transporter Tol [Isosphaeraceae bacterium]
RYEVVVQDAPDHQRVFQSRAITNVQADVARLPALAVVWSPDGRYLAVPQLQPRGLAILRADNGRLVAMLDDGYLPSWSPDNTKLAFFRSTTPQTLCWVDTNFGSARRLIEVSNPAQPPVWTRDGQSVLVAVRKMRKDPDQSTADEAHLIRVRVENGQTEKLCALVGDGQARNGNVRSVSFGLDRDAEELFFSPLIEGMPNAITWFRIRDGSVYKRFSPLDPSLPVGALSVAPVGKRLALRVGPPDLLSPPALCNLDRDELLTPLVPDDDARLEWIATIVSAARAIIVSQIPAPGIDGQTIERATLLPSPGEVSNQNEGQHRLFRLAKVGRPLCDRPAGSPPADAELQGRLDEARLFFDYLLHRYPAALEALEAVEQRTTDPHHRLRLLALRAQIYLGLADLERARATIGYLQSVQSRPPQRFEVTPDGRAVLTADPEPSRRWPDFLAERALALQRGLEPGDEPADNGNPDAPQPGLGLDQQDQLIPVERIPHRDGLPFLEEEARPHFRVINPGMPPLPPRVEPAQVPPPPPQGPRL